MSDDPKEEGFSELELKEEAAHLHLADEFNLGPTLAEHIWKWCAARHVHMDDDGFQKLVGLFRAVVLGISESKNPQLSAISYRLAFGFRTSNKESMRSHARSLGVTVNAVSKRVLALQRSLNLPRGPFNKSALAQMAYQKSNGNSAERIAARVPKKKEEKMTPVLRMVRTAPKRFESLMKYWDEYAEGTAPAVLCSVLLADPRCKAPVLSLFSISKLEDFSAFVDAILEHRKEHR